MIFCCLLIFFQFNFFFQKCSFRNPIRVSNSLDQDLAQHFVGPDLGPNCLQMFSIDKKDKSNQSFLGVVKVDKL